MKGRLSRRLFATITYLLIPISLFAKTFLLSSPATGNPEEVKILFNLENYTLEKAVINGEVCTYVGLEGAVCTEEKDFPMLPVVARSVIIPNDAAMGLEIVAISYKEVNVSKVVPSRGVIFRNQNPATIPFKFGKIYREDTWYPEKNVLLGKPYILRNVRGIAVRFQPFQYNPVKGILRIAERITVKVKKVGAGAVNILNTPANALSPSFDILYKDHFVNYQHIRPRYDFVADGEKMIIIAAGSYASTMETLAAWKNQKGIKTDLYEYPSETGGTGDAAVKRFIQGKYDSDKISYVLLVGDLDDIPSPSGGGGRSDPSYTKVAGNDHYPDLFVGRFSVSSGSEAEAMVNNALKYEKEPDPNGEWYHKSIGMASNSGRPPDNEWMDDFRDMLLAYNYTEVDKIYQGQGGTISQITSALNEGRGLFNYMGHGNSGTFGFQGASMSSNSFKTLNNSDKLPLLISVACNNGQFDKSDCIAEVATYQSGKGALAFVGSYISQAWNPPQHGQKEMVRLITTDDCISIGGIIYNGGSKILDQSSSSSYVNTFLTWTLFGDPSIMLFTDKPATLNATYPDVIGTGSQDVEISFGESLDGRVCLYSTENGILGSKIVSDAGSATLSVNIADDEESVTLTITGRNKMPFIKDIEINSGPYLRVFTPVNGDAFFAGDKTTITWITGGGANVQNVKIEYSVNNGTSYETVVASAPNKDSYEWTVPDVDESDQCVIQVTEAGGSLIGTSEVFAIKQKAHILLDQASFDIALKPNTSAEKKLNVSNTGKGKLTYSISTAGGANILINEIYISERTFYDGFEIWNQGIDADLSGWKLQWNDNANSSGSYTFPSGFTLKAGGTLVLMDEEEQTNNSTLYLGLNLAWVWNSTELSIAILDSDGKGVDFVKSSGNNDQPPAGTQWNGTGVSLSNDYVYRTRNEDNDDASDWTSSSSGTQNRINQGQTQSSGYWLLADPLDGTVDASGNIELTITFDAANIDADVYYDTLSVFHNDPDKPSPILIPVKFTVDPQVSILDIGKDQLISGIRYVPGRGGNGVVYFNVTVPSANKDLKIFNCMGNLVYEDNIGEIEPWHLTNRQGMKVASGVYLIVLKLKQNDETVTLHKTIMSIK